MNSTESLLDEVIARLEPLKAVAKVDKFPSKGKLSNLAHPKAGVWVGYAGSTYGREQAVDHAVQPREVLFDVGLVTRELNGPNGATNYIDMVRSALHGFRLSHGTPLTVRDERFVDSEQGLHRYVMVFAMRTTLVPVFTQQEYPPFIKATIESILSSEDTTIEASDEEE